MTLPSPSNPEASINTFDDFVGLADYSLMDHLKADPDANDQGVDHLPRQVNSGHYVPVRPTALPDPEYITHSHTFFKELGMNDALVCDDNFRRIFCGDLTDTRSPMRPVGWATGYALSIYGTEYTLQCPFGTGNGYGDGRAISVAEVVVNGQRWEIQLKGGGQTPYCRGADGRAVLRSSVREFLAQEHMHALGIPTSRSFTLFVSKTETASRPWYSQDTCSINPDIMIDNPVAISTRVAPSFLRVGQLELFARRVRNNTHDQAFNELRMIVAHVIEREYKNDIDQQTSFADQLIALATLFRQRLISLVANWLRVGYCQGNFNSDNCAAGGFTLDYGPFGFCEIFDTEFQPWTGGGKHFSFLNQPTAAEANFHMFWTALRPLLLNDKDINTGALEQFDQVRIDFAAEMQNQTETMWAAKLGLEFFEPRLFQQLQELMTVSGVDYTIFFRELSHIPDDISAIKKSFYVMTTLELDERWRSWLNQWRDLVTTTSDDLSTVSNKMKRTNPKYSWREWLVVPAYQQARCGDYTLTKELQNVLSRPYDEQSEDVEEKYYRLKPEKYFTAGGVSHYSCSS